MVTNQGKLMDENGRTTNIIKTDIAANNGVVHVIDRVLLPKYDWFKNFSQRIISLLLCMMQLVWVPATVFDDMTIKYTLLWLLTVLDEAPLDEIAGI